MHKNTLKRLVANPNFIAGIYNYCDRWCERCEFTARCLSFALERAEFPDDASRDARNTEFWAEIGGMLHAAIELLYEMAEERGCDLDAVDTTEIMAEQERQDEAARAHPCAVASRRYADQVDEWFDAASDLFREKGEALAAALRMNLAAGDPAEDVNRLSDATAVIRWYQFQIHVKLVRALQGRRNEAELAAGLADFPKDSDGSAKVALIGLDRSIAAWRVLLQAFPARETETLGLLVSLARLRRAVEQEFPVAGGGGGAGGAGGGAGGARAGGAPPPPDSAPGGGG
jgi:hypothetical protein